MSDLTRDVESSNDTTATGRIPAYLSSLNMIQNILSEATGGFVTPLQTHECISGSSVPLSIKNRNHEIAFFINLPIIAPANIYRLKDVVNAGKTCLKIFWNLW